jgi:hypothetical protein
MFFSSGLICRSRGLELTNCDVNGAFEIPDQTSHSTILLGNATVKFNKASHGDCYGTQTTGPAGHRFSYLICDVGAKEKAHIRLLSYFSWGAEHPPCSLKGALGLGHRFAGRTGPFSSGSGCTAHLLGPHYTKRSSGILAWEPRRTNSA